MIGKLSDTGDFYVERMAENVRLYLGLHVKTDDICTVGGTRFKGV